MKIFRHGREWLQALSALSVFCMMTVSLVDVLGRKLLSRPLRGSVELIELLLLVAVFMAWPLVSRRQGHITLDLVDSFVPRSWRQARDRLGEFCCGLLMLGAAWLAGTRALQARAEQEVSTLLGIGLWPFYALVVLLFVLTALAHLQHAWRPRAVPVAVLVAATAGEALL